MSRWKTGDIEISQSRAALILFFFVRDILSH